MIGLIMIGGTIIAMGLFIIIFLKTEAGKRFFSETDN